MLVLSRHIGQSIVIGKDIIIRVSRVQGTKVTLGIEAPDEVPIDRTEIRESKDREGPRRPAA